MQYQHILFDLDGTLTDPREGITRSVQHALARLGIDEPDLQALIRKAIATSLGQPTAERLIWDLRYAAIMCRIHYRRIKAALPDGDDVWALAHYWKDRYNTHLGAGTVQEFVNNYRRVAT